MIAQSRNEVMVAKTMAATLGCNTAAIKMLLWCTTEVLLAIDGRSSVHNYTNKPVTNQNNCLG